jgi:integrase
MTDLTVTTTDLTQRAALDDAVRENIVDAKAKNTRRAYTADWAHFTAWCAAHDESSLPADPATVARYLSDIADAFKVATLERRLVGIATAHRYASLESPTVAPVVRETFKGIKRRKARSGEQQTQKEAAVTGVVVKLVETLDDTMSGVHDRALILIGFAGAFRRSELAALDVADVKFVAEGLVITVKMSKTDQEGIGAVKGIPYGSHIETCPVRSLKTWLEKAAITEGPIFRHIDRHGNVRPKRLNAGSIPRIIKEAAAKAGLDPTQFSGHSLRAGLATAAAEAGVSERAIMAQTGHKSVVVARRYIRRGSLFKDNAAAEVGL